MRSSLDKHRDIARSILPSRHRRLSRHDLPRARRRTRRLAAAEVRETARWVRRGADGWLDYEGDPSTYDDEIPMLVRRRRQGDKLNHFERWAVMSTRDLPVADRYPTLRRVLPDTLPGRHALTHLEDMPALGTETPRWTWWAQREQLEDRWRDRRQRHLEQVRAGLVDALEHGDQADLNRTLRRLATAAGEQAPALRTADDIEPMLAALVEPARARPGSGNGGWRRLTMALDEVVDGWRHLPPVPGPAPEDDDRLRWTRHQSNAAGLSWLRDDPTGGA